MSDPYVSKAKREQLAERMVKVGLCDDDLVERFIVGSGKGGQKVNKTSSCVYLKDPKSGLDVKCQRSRSREMNRFLARRDLCDKVAEQILGEQTRRAAEAAKIRRQKRRRSRRQKERMLDEKHRQGEKKQLRRSVGSENV